MKFSQKIFNFIINHIEFPYECKSGTEHNWMLKNNCPACIVDPIECLSNSEYHEKYPAKNRIDIGATTVYLCDVHLEELRHILNSSGGVNNEK